MCRFLRPPDSRPPSPDPDIEGGFMLGSPHRTRGFRAVLALGVLAALAAAVGLIPAARQAASAQPPAAAQLPPELQLVPADAAVFVHADAAQIWDGSIG